MNILFIHQNFPGQFLHLARYAAAQPGNTVIGLGEAENIMRRGSLQGITTLGYTKPAGAGKETHHYLQNTEAETRRGQTVLRSLVTLRKQHFEPDVICLHPGWGEGLFIRDLFPHTPVIMLAEFFFRSGEADIGFDPEFPVSLDWLCSVRLRNTTQLISLEQANVCLSPTAWQASRYPWYIQKRSVVQHDGIDTTFMCPSPHETLTIQPLATPGESMVVAVNETHIPSTAEELQEPKGPPITFTRETPVITYMARNLEPYRGFHTFMRALPHIQKNHPDAHILIVGGTSTSYSPAPATAKNYKEQYLTELHSQLDLSRIHFLGRIPYLALRAMFRISRAHVYLTYPFVLSWSVLEAMACETPLVASNTAPVQEVATHEKTALLVDFFDPTAVAAAVQRTVDCPQEIAPMRSAARQMVVERFELKKCLAANYDLLQKAAAGAFPLR